MYFMNILRKAALLIAVLGLAGFDAAQAQDVAPAPFSITISSPHIVVKAGSDVYVDIRMTNTSTADVYYAVGAGPVFQIEVHDTQGKRAPEGPLGFRAHRPRAISRLIARTLKPGETYEVKGSLNSLYDLSNPGTYVIQAQRMDPQSKVLVNSNTISVTVTP
jgi:hypothetical protein